MHIDRVFKNRPGSIWKNLRFLRRFAKTVTIINIAVISLHILHAKCIFQYKPFFLFFDFQFTKKSPRGLGHLQTAGRETRFFQKTGFLR